MDTPQTITHISLCAGYGGIDLGLKRAIPDLRTIAFSEIEGYACANLVAKMEAGLLDAAPIWTNLKTFPWSEFSGKVDILSGGYPCQPFSAAGKRLGTEDPRHLWPFIADGIRLMQPRVCFFENVEGHVSLGLRAVIEELGNLGYETTWGIFSASEVGAPHQRKRIFILAHLINERLQGRLCGRTHQEWKDINGYAGCGGAGGGSRLADSNSAGSRKDWKQSQLWTVRTEQSSSNCWNPESTKGNQGWPSRPGEPQHGWEPPQVVANAKHDGHVAAETDRGICGSEQDSRRKEEQSSVEQLEGSGAIASLSIVGNSNSQHRRASTERRKHDPEAGSTGESLGNAEGGQDHGRESRDLAEESGCGTGGNHAADCTGEMLGNAHSPRPQERTGQRGAGIQGTHANGGTDAERQAQPSLGRDADGSASGLDYAELCISGDNRTDELRLLGNGVVPDTATRAFLTLVEELNESPSLPTSSR